MSMKDKTYLVDSNIIIYHLNNSSIATEFLQNSISISAISQLTFLEVLSFDFSSEEQQKVIELLEKFTILDTSKDISLQAIKNKKIKLADNIIASTAQVYDLTLVTRNTKDFNQINVKILNPFLKEED